MSSLFPIPRQIRREDIVAVDGQTTFAPVAFRAYAAEDVRVLLRRSGDEIFLPLVTGYKVQLIDKPPSFVRVTLTRASIAGEIVRIEGARTPSRTTDVTLAGVIRALSLEAELDRIAVTQQEHRRDLDDMNDLVGRLLLLMRQIRNLLQGDTAARMPSALDFLDAVQASAARLPGAPVLSVVLPPDPIAAVALSVSPLMDDASWRIWSFARSGAPSTPFTNLVAAALGLTVADVGALATYALTFRAEEKIVSTTPLTLLDALSAAAEQRPGAPKLSVGLPADPIGALSAAIEPTWDNAEHRVWKFARSAEPGSPFYSLVQRKLGLSSEDMSSLISYIGGI